MSSRFSEPGLGRLLVIILFLVIVATFLGWRTSVKEVLALGQENVYLPLVANYWDTPTLPVSVTPPATATGTATATPTATATATPTSTSTATNTPTLTNTSTATATSTSTNTATKTPTPTDTTTPTNTPLPEYGNQVVAFNAAGCQGQQNGAGFHGFGDFNFQGGSIFSNGCLRGDGDISVSVIGGGIYANDLNITPGSFSPAPVIAGYTLSEMNFGVPQPDCTGLPNQGFHSGGGNVSPGIYSGIVLTTTETLIMQPGLYCLVGDFRITDGSVDGQAVTINMQQYADFLVDTTGTITLTAPISPTTPQAGVPDVLLYADPSASPKIIISGSADTQVQGVIFSPESDIDIVTGSVFSFTGQVLGWNIEIGGLGDLHFFFVPEHSYPRQP